MGRDSPECYIYLDSPRISCTRNPPPALSSPRPALTNLLYRPCCLCLYLPPPPPPPHTHTYLYRPSSITVLLTSKIYAGACYSPSTHPHKSEVSPLRRWCGFHFALWTSSFLHPPPPPPPFISLLVAVRNNTFTMVVWITAGTCVYIIAYDANLEAKLCINPVLSNHCSSLKWIIIKKKKKLYIETDLFHFEGSVISMRFRYFRWLCHIISRLAAVFMWCWSHLCDSIYLFTRVFLYRTLCDNLRIDGCSIHPTVCTHYLAYILVGCLSFFLFNDTYLVWHLLRLTALSKLKIFYWMN